MDSIILNYGVQIVAAIIASGGLAALIRWIVNRPEVATRYKMQKFDYSLALERRVDSLQKLIEDLNTRHNDLYEKYQEISLKYRALEIENASLKVENTTLRSEVTKLKEQVTQQLIITKQNA
ncbi:MAG: hypothetical protein JO001_05815 [Alphaproteobacteria bacterium]|nr:hypothetical protein [Alphaproteobacteria bacterium]